MPDKPEERVDCEDCGHYQFIVDCTGSRDECRAQECRDVVLSELNIDGRCKLFKVQP